MTQPIPTTPAPMPAPTPAEAKTRRVELLISALLRTGVLVSLILIFAGTVLSFIHHPDYASSQAELARLTGPGAAFPHTIPEVADGIGQLRGRAFVAAGLLVLIATPVMRVAVSIVGFIYQSDRTFVVITSIVLAILLLSFLVGKVEH